MKILIFSSSAGNGHNSTAKCLTEKILQENPKAQIKLIDTYAEYGSKFNNWIMTKGYFLVCTHLVCAYNHFFKKGEKLKFKDRFKTGTNKNVDQLLYGMLKEIYSFQPDLIISTYVFCSVALSNLKRAYNIPAEIMCMALDYGISPYWECCSNGLDKMFLTDDYMLQPFKEKGYSENQLIVSGIPVAEKFSQDISQDKARKTLELDEKMFTLIIMKSAFFPLSNKDILKQLKFINNPIQVIVINGQNKQAKTNMDNLLRNIKTKHKVINIGFTNQMVEYLKSADLVLGKAGGLSTTECINAGVPSLILNKLPQQEIYNKEYLIKNGCALEVTKNNIAEKINYLLENPNKLKDMKQSTLKLQKKDTLDKFYKYISTRTKPDYSKVKMPQSKRELIKAVRTARKEAYIKDQLNNK